MSTQPPPEGRPLRRHPNACSYIIPVVVKPRLRILDLYLARSKPPASIYKERHSALSKRWENPHWLLGSCWNYG